MSILINIANSDSCPCHSGKSYGECCQKYHSGEAYPNTAEQLMRSRFSAFSLGLIDYLLKTWAQTTRPAEIELDSNIEWTNLVINGRKKGRKRDQEGWVTFMAHYQVHGQPGYLHEKSYFTRNEEGHWQYVDGEIKD